MKEEKIDIIINFNSLLDVEEAKKGSIINEKRYQEFCKKINKDLLEFRKEYPEIKVTYFFNPNTNKFSIYSMGNLTYKFETKCYEFLSFLNEESENFGF